jgi:hypothetical protein
MPIYRRDGMADVIDASVLDTVNTASTNGIAQAGAFAFGNRYNDDVGNAKISGTIAEAHLGRMLRNMNGAGLEPSHAAATAKLFSGEANSAIASLLAQLASGQIGSKIGNSTPPESGVPNIIEQMSALISLAAIQSKAAQSTPKNK